MLHTTSRKSFALKALPAAMLLAAGLASATDVAPYYEMWYAGNNLSLTQARQQLGLNSVTLAFTIANGNSCAISNDGSGTDILNGGMKADIATFRQAGGRVIASFGGAAGTYLEAVCSVDAMVNLIDGMITTHGIKALDFDVEGGSLSNATYNSTRSAAIKQLQAKYPDLYVSFTLPVMPTGLTTEGVNAVKSAINAGVRVDMVNVMAMDYGSSASAGKKMGDLAVQAAQSTFNQIKPLFPGLTDAQIWAKVGVTPMLGVNDVQSEVFGLADAQILTDFAKQKGLGLIAWWSFHRDNSSNGASKANFEFWNIFKNAQGGVVVPTPTPSVTPTATPVVTPVVTATPKPTVTPTPTPGGVAAWDKSTIYTGGQRVVYNGVVYEAQWWTQGEVPGAAQWGPWKVVSGSTPVPSSAPTVAPTTAPTIAPTATPTARPSTPTPTPVVTATPVPGNSCAVWAEGSTYKAGDVVSYSGQSYTALSAHTAYVGAGWTPSTTPTLWKVGGACGTATPAPTATPTATPVVTPVVTPAVPTATPVVTPGGTTPTPTSPAVTNTPAPTVPGGAVPAPSEKQVGSYFAQWGVYGRSFEVVDFVNNGSAAQMTFLNYAFGNIYQKNGGYECAAGIDKLEQGATNPNAPDAGTGGDAWADYGRPPARQVNPANAITWETPLAGNFHELKDLKAKFPNLKVFISLGGWTWSKWFSAAAKTDALRKQLVASCLDIYIKGNLPSYSGRGGSGSLAGVFDGIDVDWEFPGVVGQPYNTVSAEDKQNFTLLMAEFRAQLNALSAANGNKKYYLTAAMSAGKDKIEMTEPAKYSQYLDWINLMTYDFHGGWEYTSTTYMDSAYENHANPNAKTDFHSNLYADPKSPNYLDPVTGQRGVASYYTIDDAVTNLTAAGFPANKIVLGVPFYGRGWTGVPNVNNGLYQTATQPARGTWEGGIEDFKVLKNAAGTIYTHDVTKQSWKFDGSTFWSYDTPEVIQTKINYSKAKGLAGMFSWSLDGDDSGATLMKAMSKVKQ
ncbi:glycosyl hydrolase family 18 protein [Chitinibacter tainanensis]|uniref:glycosyl hydrolase family 18 protein n=1 Tax=Chitinibacter tainanensis TaxID=230667 RepID=UPI0023568F86|nr:glycosyl hydrolase family 18 protein [Chitinibacter tainanensis]